MTRLLRWCAAVALACTACLIVPRVTWAQGGILVQGVYDAELWKTDSASTLLARNEGKPGVVGRINFWSAVEPWRNVVLFGQVRGEAGSGRRPTGSEVRVDQYGARWSPSEALALEGGKMVHVVGVFSARHLSFRNPLIGEPDGYALVYPLGVKLSGSRSIVDYRAAVLSLPVWHDGYTPKPSHAPRPAIGFGITPFMGFRVGASATVGPYLGRGVDPIYLTGQDWRSYRQQVLAADVQLSGGYLEANAELAHARYDVPGRSSTANGLTWYAETKYTFTPRLYVASRVERNDYPFILPVSTPAGPSWIASNSDVTDVEVGGGFRPTSSTLVKLSVRADHRVPNPNPRAPQASGRAIAMQFSQTFDLAELLRD
jgi:hypothetical protein